MKPVILTFTHYYLPGNLAGGPIRSVANIVDLLSNEFEFYIVTTDRDYGANTPYNSIKSNQWNTVGNAKVYYISKTNLGLFNIAKLIRETPHDLIYLNSFFDPIFTIQPLIANYLRLFRFRPLIIAPRGEFSEGAYTLKKWKKIPYVFFTKNINFYKGVLWHASTTMEAHDITRVFKLNPSNVSIDIDLTAQNRNSINISIAPNLISAGQDQGQGQGQGQGQSSNALKVCFLSRICPKKNLDYALKILADVKVPIDFSIYGPQEDQAYWLKCQSIIDKLPEHIKVYYQGDLDHDLVVDTLSQHQLFFLPTLGENFGHVIYEALQSGLPVLLSDQTPWLDLDTQKVGWALPLDTPSAFVDIIEQVAIWDDSTRQDIKNNVLNYATEKGNTAKAIKDNVMLFRRALFSTS